MTEDEAKQLVAIDAIIYHLKGGKISGDEAIASIGTMFKPTASDEPGVPSVKREGDEQLIDRINLDWYDGPVLDAGLIDLGEDKLPHYRYLVELVMRDPAPFRWSDDGTDVVRVRLSLDSIQQMLELYRRHAPPGGRPIGI